MVDSKAPDRQARLAAALRANLARRKAQQRGRSADASPMPSGSFPDDGGPDASHPDHLSPDPGPAAGGARKPQRG